MPMLDVRNEVPARRHGLIFEFAAEDPDRSIWDYLWRVRIGRTT